MRTLIAKWIPVLNSRPLSFRIEVRNGIAYLSTDDLNLGAHHGVEIAVVENFPVVVEGYFTQMYREQSGEGS